MVSQRASADVFVVMATYNGAAFLAEQVDSIRAQTFRDWVLLVRDDGSTDETVAIVEDFSRRDERIRLLRDELGNLGPSASFGRLMEAACREGARYVACSDQDDFWLPGKLEAALEEARAAEQSVSPNVPVLVHSDLEVVDEAMEPISDSFYRFENIPNPACPPLTTLVVQNHVVGCTMLANRALLELAMPVPHDARMHDWWLALVARVVGELRFLPNADIRYRQHSSNTLGAAGFAHVFHVFSRSWWVRLSKRARIHKAIVAQVMALRARAHESGVSSPILDAASSCLTRPFGFARIRCGMKLGLSGQNWVTTLLFYSFLLLSSWGAADRADSKRGA